MGISVAGYPNFFLLYGPNTNGVTSIIFLLEAQVHYVMAALRHMHLLGLASLGAEPREAITIPFAPDDQMLFYTDGVSEARNRAGEFYPLPDRALYAEATDPDSALDRLQEDVLTYVGHALDDDAAMLLCYLGRQPTWEG